MTAEVDLLSELPRRLLRGCSYLLVLIAPLPFASVGPASVLALELVAAGMGAVALWIVATETGVRAPTARSWAAASVVVLIWLGLQAFPLPVDWTRVLVPTTHELRAQLEPFLPEGRLGASAPTSLAPPATVDAGLRVAAWAVIGLSALLGFVGERQIRTLGLFLVVSGAFQGIYGAAEYLSGHQHILGHAKIHYLESATGTFVNRNHYAVFLAMCLPVTLDRFFGRGPRLRSLAGYVFGFSAVFSIVVGIALSYSRSGLALALLGTVAYVALSGVRGKRLAVTLSVLSVPLAYLLWLNITPPGARFATDASELLTLGSRVPVWTRALQIVAEYPAVGVGGGAFEPVFRLYQEPETRALWEHAHNEYLEWVVELGWMGGALACGAFAVGWVLCARSRRRILSSHSAGPAVALLVLLLHAAVDFPFRIPALAVTAAILGGALLSAREEQPLVSFSEEKSRITGRRRKAQLDVRDHADTRGGGTTDGSASSRRT